MLSRIAENFHILRFRRPNSQKSSKKLSMRQLPRPTSDFPSLVDTCNILNARYNLVKKGSERKVRFQKQLQSFARGMLPSLLL